MTTYPAQTAYKKTNWWKWAAILIAVVFGICVLGGVLASLAPSDPPKTSLGAESSLSPSSPAASTASKAAAVAPASASPTPAQKTFGSGTYVVGKEMPAGRYTVTMIDNQYCYWERLKSDSGDLDDIIANEVYMDKGKRSFTVKAGDKFVQLKGDCEWKRG